MKKCAIKFLTFAVIISGLFFHNNAHSQSIQQIDNKAYLRWSLPTAKDQLAISTEKNTLIIQSLNKDAIDQIYSDLKNLNLKKEYFSSFEHEAAKNVGAPSKINVHLKDQSIEVFDFYQDETKKYVVDFWINQDLVAKKESSIQRTIEPEVQTPVKPVAVPKKMATPKPAPVVVSAPVKKEAMKPKEVSKYRDFRYGASFIWDYDAMIPVLARDINTASKAPNTLYQIPDMGIMSDARDEHMQLTINFFNKKEWGLMTRSIDLYEKKYGTNSHSDINDYLKANALILDNIDKNTKSVRAAAINLLEGIVEKTKNYEMKVASLRYVLQSALDNNDYIKALEVAKKLYVEATEKFNDNLSRRAISSISYSLAKLKQPEKISEFIGNKSVERLMPAQITLSYFSYINLANGDEERVIQEFEKNEKSLVKPIESALLFNTAEAYFRRADYQKALNLFDTFVKENSHVSKVADARLRLALSYDLLGKNPEETFLLYKDTINNSSEPAISYEAKLRMLGLHLARKREVSEQDKEFYSFFEASAQEEKTMTKDLRKLLWLTRLRVKINAEEYEEALAYLQVIPLDTFTAAEKRVFQGDGAEAVLGRILQAYKQNDYSRAVKTWEVFKDKYQDKVAANPYLNFIVSESYIHLGLFDSFERASKELREQKGQAIRSFPRWVEITKNYDVDSLLAELDLAKFVKSEDWNSAKVALEKISKEKLEKVNYNFYKGIINFKLSQYTESVASFERVFLSSEELDQLTANQTIEMLSSYAESLYQLDDAKKFQKNAAAILQDLNKFKSPKIADAKERIHYLLIESFAAESNTNYSRIEKLSKEFTNQFNNSAYKDRVTFLLGISLLKTTRLEEGKKVLNNLVNAEGTPGYLKDMARSELATIELSTRQL